MDLRNVGGFKGLDRAGWSVEPGWGGRPKRAKTHGKKHEHGRFSWNLGTKSSGTFQ
jgi:hypothetical protein